MTPVQLKWMFWLYGDDFEDVLTIMNRIIKYAE